jgi:phi13 family phage major tail protein
MATKIGCDGLVYAIMTDPGSDTVAPTWGPPKVALGVMHININPNSAQETLFADDGPMETASTLGKIEVEIQKNALKPSEKADLLGHQIDTMGGLVSGDTDIPPYVAIGFRTLKSNGTYRYVWLYKGMFMDPEDNSETKGDGINFQADTITGNFLRIDKFFTINGKKVRPWKYEIDEDDIAADETLLSNWFTQVQLPTAGDATLVQEVTGTVASGASAAGTLVVRVTAADLSGGYKDVNVDVSNSDSATVVAAKIRAAFVLDSDIYGQFHINGTNATIKLKTRNEIAVDETLAIAIQDADDTGVSLA